MIERSFFFLKFLDIKKYSLITNAFINLVKEFNPFIISLPFIDFQKGMCIVFRDVTMAWNRSTLTFKIMEGNLKSIGNFKDQLFQSIPFIPEDTGAQRLWTSTLSHSC